MRFGILYDGLLACLHSWKFMSFVLACTAILLTTFDGYDLDLSWAHIGKSLRHQLRLVNDVFEMALPNEPLSILGSRYESFDLASGAQFFNEQTMHLTNAWALIEGLGVPAGTIFDPYRKLRKFSYRISGENDILSRKELAESIRILSQESRSLDRSMEEFSLQFLMGSLPLHFSDRPLNIALDYVHAMQSESDMVDSRLVDRSIRRMARAVIDDLSALFEKTFISANVSLTLAETASITASSVLAQFDSELSRVKLVIANTPWWKSWTWDHWLYRSELSISRRYLKQLIGEEIHILYHSDGVLAVGHNLQLLVHYINWYLGYIKQSEPHKRPRRGARSAREEIEAFNQALNSLTQRADENYDAQDRVRVIRHPRKITLPLALPRSGP